jgi:hypothetical protein
MGRSLETAQSVLTGSSMTGKYLKKKKNYYNMWGINEPELALAGATTGATIAVLKNAPVKQYTISTGLNCGVFGATFFCKKFN